MKYKSNTAYIIKDNFSDNRYGWEVVDSPTEKAAIARKGYVLENRNTQRWHHFSLFPALASLRDISIRCSMEIAADSGMGQMGLMWGYNEKLHQINRFCLSTSGIGCSVMHFERNHLPVFHRFYDPFVQINTNKPVMLEVREGKGYWYFRMNKQLVYIGHQIHFSNKGSGMGFYLDPGVKIRISTFEVTQRYANKVFSLN